MVDLAKLVVRLEAENSKLTSALNKSSNDLRRFEGQAKKSFNSIKGTLKGGLIALGAGFSAGLFIDVIKSGEKLKASLETVVGSVEGANVAFEALEEFAAKTPFSLDQVTDAFIKLKALGLDASIESIKSYGNTAAALGKPLTQVIEAVADAATNEFERLKEFGIKAKQQGDTVSFTFQGVTTSVKKNAKEITEYLRDIGDVKFAGAIDRQAKTLDGALSNLGDSFAGLIREIGKAGLANAIQKVANKVSDLATAVSNLVKGEGKGLPEWAKVSAFAIHRLAIEAGDLPDAITAMLASVVAVANFDKSTLEYIAADRRQARLDIEAASEAYVASLEGLTKPKKSNVNPFGTPPPGGGGGDGDADKAKKTFQDIKQAIIDQAEAIRAANIDLERGNTIATDELEITRAIAQARKDLKRDLTSAEESVITSNVKDVQVLKDYQDTLTRVKNVYEEIRNPADELTQKFADMQTLLDQGKISWDTYADAVFKAQDAFEAAGDTAKTKTDEMTEYARQAARNMQDAFANFLFDPFKDGLSGMLDNFVTVLRQMAAQAAAAQIFGKEGSGGLGDIITSAATSIFGGGKAIGGPVDTSHAYLVGEKGPELFVPKTAGTILPNGTAGAITVHVSMPQSASSQSPTQFGYEIGRAINLATRRNG